MKTASKVITNYKIHPLNINIKDKVLADLVKDKLPVLDRFRVSFNINADISVLNAIRRVMIGELEVNVLHFDLESFKTDEAFTNDWFQGRLRLIPIVPHEDLTAKIDITNNSHETITVYTKDIQFSIKDKNIPWDQVCDSYPIAFLEMGQSLLVENIKSVKRYGYEMDGEGTVATNIIYDPEQNFMQYDTMGNFHGTAILNMVCQNLIDRLKNIDEFIKDRSETHYTNIYNLIIGNTNELIINGESHTIGGLITKFVYLSDTSIGLINYKEIHPTERAIKIKWQHPSGTKILSKAINHIINIFEVCQQK